MTRLMVLLPVSARRKAQVWSMHGGGRNWRAPSRRGARDSRRAAGWTRDRRAAQRGSLRAHRAPSWSWEWSNIHRATSSWLFQSCGKSISRARAAWKRSSSFRRRIAMVCSARASSARPQRAVPHRGFASRPHRKDPGLSPGREGPARSSSRHGGRPHRPVPLMVPRSFRPGPIARLRCRVAAASSPRSIRFRPAPR